MRQSRHIRFTYLLTQIIFWTLADLFLSLIIGLVNQINHSDLHDSFAFIIYMAMGVGIFQGIVFGITDQVLDNQYFRKQSIGKILLVKVGLYFMTTLVIIVLTRLITQEEPGNPLLNMDRNAPQNISWQDIFNLTLLYHLGVAPIITFINQVNRKFGHHVLRSLILGKYRSPREEYRAFLFMDLTASTTIAESLGHFKYSAFIRDCFMDINMMVPKHDAEIYQYAGDEIILSWKLSRKTQASKAVEFFEDCRKLLKERASYYQEKYGLCPDFKAAAHLGYVTAVEIGDIKRDIAYHGDVLNTTSRLQHLCNAFGEKLLLSSNLADQLDPSIYPTKKIGAEMLKGKADKTDVYVIENRFVN